MSNFTQRYDASKKALVVFYDFDEPMTLVPTDETKKWGAMLREGETSKGQPINAVHVVFASRESATYNQQALDFMRLHTCVGTLEDYEIFDGRTEFPVKEDFGI